MRSNPVPAIITGFLLTVFAMTPHPSRGVTAAPPPPVAASMATA